MLPSRLAGVAATAAAIVASIGDLLLLHVSMAGASFRGELLAGAYLGVLAIPCYGLGYWHVSRGLAPASAGAAAWVFRLGAYTGAVGAAVHGITAVVIAATAGTSGDAWAVLAPYAALLLPLWLVLGALAVAISLLQVRLCRTGRTAFPRWFAWTNPVALVALVGLASLPSPALAAYLVPAAPNLAQVIYFALSTVLLGRTAASG